MKNSSSFWWGALLILLGILLTLNAFNIDVFFDGWWTLFIIIPSIIGLFRDKDKVTNLIGLLIGVLLLLNSLDVISFRIIGKLIFPIALVVAGVVVIFKNVFSGKIKKEIETISKNTDGAREDYASTFSSLNLNFSGKYFKGTDLSVAFGGITCDLREAIITEDTVINASAVFGGIDILLPDNVNIKIESNSIFGGVSNKHPAKIVPDAPTVYVNGSGIFGGVEIK